MKLPPCTDTLRLDFFTNPDFNVAKLMPSESQALGSVLVTGASGFVGSAIASELRRSGYAVRVLVRLVEVGAPVALPPGTPAAVRKTYRDFEDEVGTLYEKALAEFTKRR